jgi:hypothetical protein
MMAFMISTLYETDVVVFYSIVNEMYRERINLAPIHLLQIVRCQSIDFHIPRNTGKLDDRFSVAAPHQALDSFHSIS